MNFFQRQEDAISVSRRIVFFFAIAVISTTFIANLVLFLFYSLINQFSPTAFSDWFSLPWWMIFSVIILVIILWGSLSRQRQFKKGGVDVARWVGAVKVKPENPGSHEKRLINVVDEMSIASGVPVPAIWIMKNEQAINAFCAGYNHNDIALVVSRGCLKSLTRDELQSVVAHEFSHIFHNDVFLNMRLLCWLAGLTRVSQFGHTLAKYSVIKLSNKTISWFFPATVIGTVLYLAGWVYSRVEQ